jgi:hypothetical protein
MNIHFCTGAYISLREHTFLYMNIHFSTRTYISLHEHTCLFGIAERVGVQSMYT